MQKLDTLHTHIQMRQLLERTVFQALREGHILISVGDYPKQAMSRMFLLSGKNHPDKELHLARLFKACDETIYEEVLAAHDLQDDEAGQTELARAAMNLFQLQGPLHCRINIAKDAAKHWHNILIAPLHRLIHNTTKCPETLHMREVMAYLQILHAGFLQIRSQVDACLIPIADRFDASALLWFFYDTLPLISFPYDGIFKVCLTEVFLVYGVVSK